MWWANIYFSPCQLPLINNISFLKIIKAKKSAHESFSVNLVSSGKHSKTFCFSQLSACLSHTQTKKMATKMNKFLGHNHNYFHYYSNAIFIADGICTISEYRNSLCFATICGKLKLYALFTNRTHVVYVLASPFWSCDWRLACVHSAFEHRFYTIPQVQLNNIVHAYASTNASHTHGSVA